MLRWIREDLLAWPGGRPIDADYEPDTYAPTTIAALLTDERLARDAEVQRLAARAATAEWTREDGWALYARVSDLWADEIAPPAADAEWRKWLARENRKAAAAETNAARGRKKAEAIDAEVAELRRAGRPEREIAPVVLARLAKAGVSVNISTVRKRKLKTRAEAPNRPTAGRSTED